jgi:hypothetical protein
MHNWAGGMQTADQGIEYRTVEDTQSGYFDETRGYRRATLHSYITSKGADAAFPGQVICQPQATTISVGSGPALGSVLKQVDFTASGGNINTFLVENQRYQHKLSGANTWTQAVDLGSGQVGKDGIVHGGFVAIGYGSGGQVYSADGASFTVATANKADAYGALNANIYRAVRPNTVYAATAINGTWDSGSSIADASFNINSLNGIEQILMIGKEDGVYSIDSEGLVVPFTPELRIQANANFASVRANESFNGDYYFRTLNGVTEISGGDGTKDRVGLDQLSSPDLPTVVVQGLAHDDRYLYALCANTSNDLMILRRTIGGAWHVFYWDGSGGTKQGQHIAVSSALGYPALFFSYYDGASAYTTKFIRLSTFPNALQDTNYRFDASTTGRFRLGRFGSSEAQVVLDQIIIQSRNCAAGVTITPYIAADGGAITQFGSSAVTSSPSTTIVPTTAVTANYIDLYFDLATNSSATTPVLVGFSLKGTYRPNYRRVHTFTFTSKRTHRDIRGGARREGPTEAIADLHTLLGTNIYQTVKDERSQTFAGMVQGLNRTFLAPQANAEPEEAIQVIVQEAALGLTPQSFTYGVATYS